MVDSPDYAAASGVDEKGLMWVYIYAVWDDLTIFITVSGDESDLLGEGNWAFQAVRSVRRTVEA